MNNFNYILILILCAISFKKRKIPPGSLPVWLEHTVNLLAWLTSRVPAVCCHAQESVIYKEQELAALKKWLAYLILSFDLLNP